MRALTVVPRQRDSLEVTELPDLRPGPTDLVVDGLAVGVCGTDKDIVAGEYGSAPPGSRRLVLGHESLGRVRHVPHGTGFRPGDLVVGVVRRPDPEPCGACAHGEFDMCRNGRFTERGIKELDGYASERWIVDPDFAVRVEPDLAEHGVLMEPASVVAKAWEQIDRIGSRSWFDPRCVLVTGAGPIGLLAALVGVQRGHQVHVLDQVAEGPKPELVTGLGATYHHRGLDGVAERIRPDVIVEATGVGGLALEVMRMNAAYGIVCLTGVSSAGRRIEVDAGALNRDIVLENDVVFGSVNANLRHYRLAAGVLAKADPGWLAGLITRRVPLADATDAFTTHRDDVKVVLTIE
jgi:glucose 1-dehydrogenase